MDIYSYILYTQAKYDIQKTSSIPPKQSLQDPKKIRANRKRNFSSPKFPASRNPKSKKPH